MLNRIPVLQPFDLTPRHNWGRLLQKPFGDLVSPRVDILLGDENGIRSFAMNCSERKDFNIEAFSESEIKRIGAGENTHISEQDNRDYPVIIRQVGRLSIWRLALDNFRSDRATVRVTFQPAQRIADIAQSVIADLGGINRSHMDFAYRLRDPEVFAPNRRPAPAGAYACAHVRGGDITTIIPLFKAGITPQMVFKNLKRSLPGRDIPLYLMTNIRDQEFFSEIKRYWPTKFADDFPQLRAFYPDGDRIGDNLSLFAIERVILQSATVRIHSHAQSQTEFALTDSS